MVDVKNARGVLDEALGRVSRVWAVPEAAAAALPSRQRRSLCSSVTPRVRRATRSAMRSWSLPAWRAAPESSRLPRQRSSLKRGSADRQAVLKSASPRAPRGSFGVNNGKRAAENSRSPFFVLPIVESVNSDLFLSGQVEDDRAVDLGARGVGVGCGQECGGYCFAFLLRAVFAVGFECAADLVKRVHALHRVPGEVGDVARRFHFFHGQSVGQDGSVGKKLVQHGVVVLLPHRAVFASLPRLGPGGVVTR